MTTWQNHFSHLAASLSAPNGSPGGVFGWQDHGMPRNGGDPWRWWWNYACWVARTAAGNPAAPLPTVDVYGPVLASDEVALVAAHAAYSRFYGGDGTYEHSGLFVFGRPAVMFGALATTAALNARRKAKARADATPSWRNEQSCRVVATNHRLLCHIGGQDWLSFYYGAVSNFQPDLLRWSLTMSFDDECVPLRIAGPPAPILSVWAGIGIEGPRWCSDPRLQPLVA